MGARVEVGDGFVTYHPRTGPKKSIAAGEDWLRALAEVPQAYHGLPHYKDGRKMPVPKMREYLWLWFMRRYEYGDARQQTLRQARREVMRIAGVIGGLRLDEVTPVDCDDVMQSVSELGHAAQKVTRKYLRAALEDAVKVGAFGHRIPSSPAAATQLLTKKRQQPSEFLRSTEIAPFLDAIEGERGGNALRLMLLCGLRFNEALSLTWGQVEYGEHWAPCAGVLVFGEEVKERKGKLVPIPMECRLEELDEELVCPEHKEVVRDTMRRALSRIGCKRPVTPHGLRRTYARQMHFVHGATVVEVQHLLGHTQLSTTLGYLQGGSEDAVGKVAMLGR